MEHCIWGDNLADKEIILIDSPGIAAAIGLRIVDCALFSHGQPALRITPNTVVLGLDFSYNYCDTAPPNAIIDASGVDVTGPTIAIGNINLHRAELFSNEVGADGCILYASQCGPSPRRRGVGIGTVRPQARFDVRRMGDEQGIVERVGDTVEQIIGKP